MRFKPIPVTILASIFVVAAWCFPPGASARQDSTARGHAFKRVGAAMHHGQHNGRWVSKQDPWGHARDDRKLRKGNRGCPNKEPDPVVTPDPDPVVPPEPDPVIVPEPEPDPVIVPEPEPERDPRLPPEV